MARKKQPRREPSHETVVSRLIGLQAELRGDEEDGSRRGPTREVGGGRTAVATMPHAAAILDLTEPEVVTIPDASPIETEDRVADVAGRLASIQARLDALEQGLASVMVQIEERDRI